MDGNGQTNAPAKPREEIPECEEWNGMKAEDRTQRVLLAYLRDNASESLAERIKAGKKTLRGAVAFVTKWARDLAKGSNAAMITSDDVFGQLMHYFEEDSLDAEGTAPAAKVEVPKPKRSKAAQRRLDAMKAADKPKPAAAPKMPAKPSGPVQLTLDWLFGGTSGANGTDGGAAK